MIRRVTERERDADKEDRKPSVELSQNALPRFPQQKNSGLKKMKKFHFILRWLKSCLHVLQDNFVDLSINILHKSILDRIRSIPGRAPCPWFLTSGSGPLALQTTTDY